MTLEQEIQRRKTFGIIAHPDAGKTTLTEKLLLFGGAIQTAGAVKSNKIDMATRSDWMDIEREIFAKESEIIDAIFKLWQKRTQFVPEIVTQSPLQIDWNIS